MILLRFFAYLFSLGTVVYILIGAVVVSYLIGIANDLPDYTALKKYQPPVMTRVHASDGSLITEYARERRLFIPSQAIPDIVKQAFMSAEDKNFYDHTGVDMAGVARAIVVNFRNAGSGRRLVGASTITQQVAKNFLLTSEVSYDRKVKEAMLAFRIEQALSKEQILELYLNEIFFGLSAYGIAAASLVYYDKSVHELSLPEVAYLAALPKGPNNYHPFRSPESAIERRNWVIDRMVANGYVSFDVGEEAKGQPLQVTPRQAGSFLEGSEYFAEAVRRILGRQYGEDGLYDGGLSVRTTLEPKMQIWARSALQKGLVGYDQRRGWRGAVATISTAGNWGSELSKVKRLRDAGNWTLAVVLDVTETVATIGLLPGRRVDGKISDRRSTGFINFDDMKWARPIIDGRARANVRAATDVLNIGDVVYVEPVKEASEGEDSIASVISETGTQFRLRQVPKVSGGIVAMDPRTGRVLALVGGFSYDESQFNRATQALRQPGSSFKPLVYAAALENGYTPATLIMDAPIEIDQGAGNDIWRPENYSGKFYGPSTMRLGIEKSRNAMTVRLAQDMGMPMIEEYSKRFGVYDKLPHYLSMSLGAGETTLLKMTNAYAILANGGRKVDATLIDRVQNRHGKTIYRHDARNCDGCLAAGWQGQDEPTLVDEREQVISEWSAYQITSMLEGVVQRGTATKVKKLNRPIAGKTGTTNDERDAWFVGFSPELVVGVYVGYDNPTPMGKGSTGGGLAAPIFIDFMEKALADKAAVQFAMPRGLQLIRVNGKTGQRVNAGGNGAILEAFKPGMYPSSSNQFVSGPSTGVSQDADNSVSQGTGGLY